MFIHKTLRQEVILIAAAITKSYYFNKCYKGLDVVQYPAADDYFYSVTTDKGDLIKIDLSGDFDVTSFNV